MYDTNSIIQNYVHFSLSFSHTHTHSRSLSLIRQKVATLVMLLAGVLACRAHDSQSTVDSEGWSTTRSAASRSENSSYPDVATDRSVVVNWLLVCEDLCG